MRKFYTKPTQSLAKCVCMSNYAVTDLGKAVTNSMALQDVCEWGNPAAEKLLDPLTLPPVPSTVSTVALTCFTIPQKHE